MSPGKKTEEEIGAGLSGWARQLVNLDNHKQTFCQKDFEHKRSVGLYLYLGKIREKNMVTPKPVRTHVAAIGGEN